MLTALKQGFAMSQSIDYGSLMHRALRGLIDDVLSDVAEHGLPGSHHFFITFDTRHPSAKLADWLRERYPEEMTIVLQHWFEGLETEDEGFGVTLNFGDNPERLYVPYDAIRTFVDPSVEFGLRFESHESEAEEEAGEPVAAEPETDEADHQDAEIVSLDSWRK
jgi:hypothetical protein